MKNDGKISISETSPHSTNETVKKIIEINSDYTTVLFCKPAKVITDEVSAEIKQISADTGGFVKINRNGNIIKRFPNHADDAIKMAIDIEKRICSNDDNISIVIITYFGNSETDDYYSKSPDKNIPNLNEFGIRIAVDENTFFRLENPNKYNYRFVGRAPESGDDKPMAIFDFMDGDDTDIKRMKTDSKGAFEESVFNFYRNRIDEAVAGFYSSLKIYPGDHAAKRYIEISGRELL